MQIFSQIFTYFVHADKTFLFTWSLVGIIAGSFLNVVIYRLPIMIDSIARQEFWQAFFLPLPYPNAEQNLNLAFPRSFCPHCKHPLRWWDNIPLLSFIVLNRHCRYCQAIISWQYPVVELLSGILAGIIAYNFGATWQTVALSLFAWSLLAASVIDYFFLFIPYITMVPILFLGLLISCYKLFITPEQAIFGSIVGYLILWPIYFFFKVLLQVTGIGLADFVLLATIGSWVGVEKLLLVIIIASLSGSVFGLISLSLRKQSYRTPIPFGPFLSAAGLIVVLWGDRLLNWNYGMVNKLF